MMRYGVWLLGLATALSAWTGCGDSGDQRQQAGKPATAKKTSAATDAPVKAAAKDGKRTGPGKAVFEFLEAVRTGNDSKATAMLTPTARKETQKLDLIVAPPGSDTARFKVGEVEMIAADLAHVACTWTDVDETGKPQSDDIIWMLRREMQGWRIAGMATKIFDDQPPLLLNFEDPKDMLRKQRLAEVEFERRATAASKQAQQQKPGSKPKSR